MKYEQKTGGQTNPQQQTKPFQPTNPQKGQPTNPQTRPQTNPQQGQNPKQGHGDQTGRDNMEKGGKKW